MSIFDPPNSITSVFVNIPLLIIDTVVVSAPILIIAPTKEAVFLTRKSLDYIIVTGGTSELRDFHNLLDKVFTKMHILGKIDIVGARSNKYSTGIGTIKYYNGRLKLKNKEYCVWNPEEISGLAPAPKPSVIVEPI